MAKKKAKPEASKKSGGRAKAGTNPILLGIGLAMGLLILGFGGLFAYIAIAPDDLPKPFYFTFESPLAQAEEEAPMDEASAEQGESQPAPHGSAAGETEAAGYSSGETAGEAAGVQALPVALPLPGEGIIFDTGTKIVNLSDPGGRRYLKIGVVLEFAPHSADFYTLEGEAKVLAVEAFNEEMSARRPVIDDLLITLLSSRAFDEIYSIEGKEVLREEILRYINEMLPGQRLMYVYFTEFVVQ